MSLPKDIVPDRDEAARRQAHDPLTASAVRAADAAGRTCPDAETLGLFAEGGLGRSDAAAVAAHVRGCARCEAIVSSIARALPASLPAAEAPVDAGAGGWLRGWRWLVPVASLAAAALVAVWLGRAPRPQMELARTDTGTEAFAPAASPAAPQETLDRLAPPAESPSAAAKARPAAPPSQPATTFRGQPPPAAPAETRPSRSAARRDTGAATEPAPTLAERAAERDAANTASPAAPPPPAPAVVMPAAPSPAVGATAAREERAKEVVGRVQREAPAAGGAAAPAAQAADARAPYPRWRVRDGVLEFARDGKEWRRISLPTTERLASVTERPDASVVVTTVTGVEFVSSDLGATWQRP